MKIHVIGIKSFLSHKKALKSFKKRFLSQKNGVAWLICIPQILGLFLYIFDFKIFGLFCLTFNIIMLGAAIFAALISWDFFFSIDIIL